MIAVSVPVTIRLTRTKIPSLIAGDDGLRCSVRRAHRGLPPDVESSSVPFLKLTGGVSGCSG